jgi:hypothetical protein
MEFIKGQACWSLSKDEAYQRMSMLDSLSTDEAYQRMSMLELINE